MGWGRRRFAARDVRSVKVSTHPGWLKVCDIKEPRTGLEVKFSYAHLAAMVATGIDTSSDETYKDSLASETCLKELARKVEVVGDESVSELAARVVIDFESGSPLEVYHDLARRLPLDALERGLRSKADSLLGTGPAQQLWSTISALDTLGELAAQLHAELADAIHLMYTRAQRRNSLRKS